MSKVLIYEKFSDYGEARELFKTLDDVKKSVRPGDTFSAILDDATEKTFDLVTQLRENLIKERKFDEDEVRKYAEQYIKEYTPQNMEIGIRKTSIGTVTGCFPVGPTTVEQVIAEYKKLNKYEWL